MCGDSGFSVTDTNGTAWGVRTGGTSGIFDSPDVRLNHVNYANADGAARSRNFRPPKQMSITGWAAGTSIAGIVASRRAFQGLLGGGGQGTLTVTDIDGTALTATVELASATKITPAALQFDWQLNLVANDPYFYGALVTAPPTLLPTSSGGLDWSTGGGLDWSTGGGLNWGTSNGNGLITLANTGVEESWPKFTVAGPTDIGTLANPSITNSVTGEQLFFAYTMQLNDVLVIETNPQRRSVKLNGVTYRRDLTIAQYFSVLPGVSVTVQFGGTSVSTTPSLTAAIAPAY
jgi:hypothetical protein